MSFLASRAALRQSRFAIRHSGRCNASSTTEAASNAASTAKETAAAKATQLSSKASEGLTKVTSSATAAASRIGAAAKSAANSAANSASNAASQQAGGMVGKAQGVVPQVVYYSKVGLELGKLVVKQRNMAPPSMETVQTYLQPAINLAKDPKTLMNRIATEANSISQRVQQDPNKVVSQVQSISREQWISAGVIFAEVIGFFSVGEIIGRFKLVGYRANEHH